MFQESPSAELRQGDICSIDGFPLWNLSATGSLNHPNGLSQLQMPVWDKVLSDPEGKGYLVAICSHDCDIENPRGRTGLILAPVLRVPAAHGTDRYAAIMASNEAVGSEYGYGPLFPLEIPGPHSDRIAAVVDFSAITAMAGLAAAIEQLKGRKRHELTDAAREQFKTKLAVFFGRP